MNDDDVERRLHRQMQEWYKAQREGWVRATEGHRVEFARWMSDNRGKLDRLHPLVCNEVLVMAWQRIKAGKDVNLTTKDVQGAEIAVVSRLRVKLYGPLTDAAYGQHQAIRAELGLGPVPITIRPKPLAA